MLSLGTVVAALAVLVAVAYAAPTKELSSQGWGNLVDGLYHEYWNGKTQDAAHHQISGDHLQRLRNAKLQASAQDSAYDTCLLYYDNWYCDYLYGYYGNQGKSQNVGHLQRLGNAKLQASAQDSAYDTCLLYYADWYCDALYGYYGNQGKSQNTGRLQRSGNTKARAKVEYYDYYSCMDEVNDEWYCTIMYGDYYQGKSQDAANRHQLASTARANIRAKLQSIMDNDNIKKQLQGTTKVKLQSLLSDKVQKQHTQEGAATE